MAPRRPELANAKGVLTLEEAKQWADKYGRTQCYSAVGVVDPVFFFTDDYCFGVGNKLPEYFVPTSTTLPLKIAPRPGFEDGWLRTLDEYISVFHRGESLLQTPLDLLIHLNA